MSELSKRRELYPDLVEAGGLNELLSKAFIEIGSSLTILRNDSDGLPFYYGRIEHGIRFSQVYIGADKRLFLFDFWRDGVLLANGRTPDLLETVTPINRWVGSDCPLTDLEEFPYIEIRDEAWGFEEGREVEMRWEMYLNSIGDDFPQLTDFVMAAAESLPLRQLFPYTSLDTFRFSRCTGYPFTRDTPYVRPRPDGRYDVTANGAVVGRGDAEVAVGLVVAHLPPDCGPAVRGTAETIGEV